MITPNPTTRTESVFGFRVGSLGFLVTSSTCCEVIEQMQVNPLPNVEGWFSGLINFLGDLIPIIDLQLLLGEEVYADDKNASYLLSVKVIKQ